MMNRTDLGSNTVMRAIADSDERYPPSGQHPTATGESFSGRK